MQKSYLSALALIGMASIVSLSACQDEDFWRIKGQVLIHSHTLTF